ncbi:cysteine desulfurase [Weissella bombi]|uniref:Putative amino acid metabolism n=1 Tax=Weissella bombi TaxID=1505725 RepID=A0A1C4A1C1_9LACO|nr:cysteine desulfurase [Weissella bombi]SCB88494.1 Putative amino acid metabolism [Weissella bombi]
MAFETTVKVTGDNVVYQFNPQLKQYALGDTGFVKNNAGSYVMKRSLEPEKGLDNAIKLKVVVDKALTGIKIKTVNPSGNATVNIFKHKQHEELEKMYRFYLNELVEREIITIK